MSQLPTYAEVQDETHRAMQRIVDELPPDSTVERDPDGTPFGCEGDGVFYTAQWVVHPGADFDGQQFIDGLPGALGDDFEVEDTGLALDFPAVSLVAVAYGDTGMNVSVAAAGGHSSVGITATSQCAQAPSD
ncbi:hypothetical protein [Microbacterium awajiense]